MTRDEAVTLMKQIMGFRKTLDTECQIALRAVQNKLELGLIKPWWMVAENHTIRTDDSGEQRIALPDGFIEETDDDVLTYIPDTVEGGSPTEVPLIKDDYKALRHAYRASSAAPPEAYALHGKYVWVFPVPDDMYQLRWTFYKRDTTLTSNIENNWLKYVPELLIGEAGLMIATAVRDAEAKAEFTRLKQEGLIMLAGHEASRESANRVYQMGGRHR